MEYVDEYRDPGLTRRLIRSLQMESRRRIRVMEICGTHTMSIFRNGIHTVLPEGLELISGPGCPVCVTSLADIDRCIELARNREVMVTTFGDLVRVPGSQSSLAQEQGKGAHIRVVYSPLDALEAARAHPHREVVFLGIGFETTAPAVAAAVRSAAEGKIRNFSVLSLHKLLPPAMEALLRSPDHRIDGFLCPGHVSAVIGTRFYESVSRRYGIPCVVAGFEALDVLEGLYRMVRLVEQGEGGVEIQYARAVRREGNPRAREIMESVFAPVDAVWRGLGTIPCSGLELRPDYRMFDASERFGLDADGGREPEGCACGEVIRGVKVPLDCPWFRKRCTPEHPLGPCMVSTEGTCAAYFKYHFE